MILKCKTSGGDVCAPGLLLSFRKVISAQYGVLVQSLGIALRGLFIINPDGILEQVR